jgi:excisionase family DNA binding protein
MIYNPYFYPCVKIPFPVINAPMPSERLTTEEAAARLHVTPARVRQLVLDGLLPAEKFGRDLSIKASDLKLVEKRRKPGRPRKAA